MPIPTGAEPPEDTATELRKLAELRRMMSSARTKDSQLQMIRVYVKTLHLQPYWQIELRVNPQDETVLQLKQRIDEAVHYPKEKQRIVSMGRILRDSRKLHEYRQRHI